MNNSLRHLNALRAFEAAARHQSIAKAGAELNVSHSVVSQHIRNLEEWLGVSLFDRHTNRISLSDEGRRFEPQVGHAFQILRDACDGMLQLNQSGTINISAEPAISFRWLRRKASEFSEIYPKIECNLVSDWQVPNLDDGHVDVVVHFAERLVSVNSRKTRLFPIDAFPACSAGLAKKIANETDDQTEIFGTAALIHDHGRHIWQQWFNKYESKSEAWKEGKTYSDLLLAMHAAIDGEGVFLADKIICAKEIADGSLVQLDSRVNRCTWYELAISEHSAQGALAETFRQWLVDQAQQERDKSSSGK